VWVLDSVFGNGIPRKFGLLAEVLRKITGLVSIVSVICTTVPAGRCTAHEVEVVVPAATQFIATPIPPFGAVPQTVLLYPIFPMYPEATALTPAYGETLAPAMIFATSLHWGLLTALPLESLRELFPGSVAQRHVFAPERGHLDRDEKNDEGDERHEYKFGHRLPFDGSAHAPMRAIHSVYFHLRSPQWLIRRD
jgi:hypothetical protein